jgi:hypothetical protein
VCRETLIAAAALVLFVSAAPCQQNPATPPPAPNAAQQKVEHAVDSAVNAAEHAVDSAVSAAQHAVDSAVHPSPHVDKHILGIIPNFRTAVMPVNYEPLKPREKFKIAAQDSFDRGTLLLAAAFAGQSQLSNDNKAFGQGVEGYSKYFGAAYADFVVGNYMTEGIFPTVLHQDPRYFRKGTGSGLSRLGYSMGQIFWTHKDSGGGEFNYSEIFGNSAAVAVSTVYYKNSRTAHDAVSSLSVQVGVDMVTNVLKEFWPDFDNKFRSKHAADADAANKH